MNMIYSSNNEESLLKAAGPFRITNSGILFAGSVLPKGRSVSETVMHGKTNLCGKQIIPTEPQRKSGDTT